MPSSLELDEARDLETASSGGDDDSEYDAPSRARFERTRATFGDLRPANTPHAVLERRWDFL